MKTRMNKIQALFLATVMVIGYSASGQVVLKQATPQEVSYVCPMVLEVTLEPFIAKAKSLPPPSGFRWDEDPQLSQKIDGLAGYICDNVSIKNLVITAYGPDEKGLQRIQFITSVSVRPGSDKTVVVTYELLSEGKSLAKVNTKKINAEEKKTRTRNTFVMLQTKGITIETPMILRITVNVEDNG